MEEPDTGQNNAQQRVKTGSARLREIRENLANSKTKATLTPTTAEVLEQMTTSAPEIEIVATQGPEIKDENILLEEANWTRINSEPPEFSTVRNLKMALGAIGSVFNFLKKLKFIKIWRVKSDKLQKKTTEIDNPKRRHRHSPRLRVLVTVHIPSKATATSSHAKAPAPKSKHARALSSSECFKSVIPASLL